ncbi:TPM domain-containing protein [Rickettsiales endosymbiont of Trichoplax sp. H2]|uniref:TPM domain-containing protein n=1 Tax=Rickettsiales endosymbiont of Trichoplax sp. H2 TaxID=2021221 RepID=UPI0012B2946F|nr:TPM domain-containing protein [Rickettsiales endosymbiont of Trichoplax sp. H2]MSO13400.1 UPF0603 protein YgcG [Rickettsiales endosymbiont of Trichoplax sp. H2]
MKKIRYLYCVILCFSFLTESSFALSFPTLTGRVVDQANVISPATKDQLTEILTNIENTTTDQIVIVTLPTLDGHSIEDYGYKLARHWGIGQKDKDNGAIIIVDVNERSIRIEVGYGLEAKLTDAVTSEIIRNQIAPSLKKGNYNQGLLNAVNKVKEILSKGDVKNKNSQESNFEINLWACIIFIIFIILWIWGWRSIKGKGRDGDDSGDFGNSGFSDDDGFSGGGGSFGGGGSSGKF